MPQDTGSRGSDRLAAVCRFLGVLSLMLVVIVSYATRVVFDADTFARQASQSLKEPEVAGFVAEQLTDAVIDQNRDLLAFRPVLVLAARSVVTSEPFRAVFRRTARTAHEVVLSRQAEQVYLSLPDVRLLLRTALARGDSELLEKIPTEVRTEVSGDLERVFGEKALEILHTGANLQRLVLWLRMGTIFLVVLGVALARDRRQALVHTGIGMGVVAFAVFWIPPVAGKILQIRLAQEPSQALVVAIWNALSGGLQARAAILAGIGLVLGAAATAMARRLTVSEFLRRAWSVLQRPLGNPVLEVGRALGLLALGLFTALEPMAALKGLFVVVGAFLAFEGLTNLFALVAPRLERSSEVAGNLRRESSSRRRLRWALVGGIALALVGTGAALLDNPPALPQRVFAGACNGDRGLCDRPVNEVVFAGAHNAMAAADVAGWMFPNHERGVTTQLHDGIRALLIDVHYGTPVSGRIRTELDDEAAARQKYEAVLGEEGVEAAMRIRDRLVGEPEGPQEPYLCHGFCELGAQPLVPVLRQVRDFLVQSPGEVLLIVVEDYVEPVDVAAAFETAGLLEFVFRGSPEPPWPTLGEMVASDERLIVLAENSSAGVPWYHSAFEVIQETPYSFHAPEEFSCEPNRGGTRGSLFQLNHWIESAPTPKPSNAVVVNAREFLLQRVRDCEAARGRQVNVIAVDFHGTGDVLDVVAELNRRPAPRLRLTQSGSTRATTTVMLSGPPR